MEKITFISAKFGQTLVNGLSVDFTIKYYKENKGLLKDITQDCWFKVTLTRFALIEWGLLNDINEEKLIKLTFPFAVEWLTERVKDGTLKEFEEKIISTEDRINPYPFDIQKIERIEGFEVIFSENNEDIGKRIQTNLIADTIIELRDNINALIYSKNKDILLKLGQERNILNLFRIIDNREQFSYAVSTLGNLVNDLNSDLLRKITGNKDKETKSFVLLEEFLNSIDSEPNDTIEIFKTINRIRQGFPIHTDKTEIIKNLKKFGIEYPILDHNETWLILTERYKYGLSELLTKIKKYAA